MLTLDLTNAPRWHDLAPGVRVQLRPLTTALMVMTRSDPAVEAVHYPGFDGDPRGLLRRQMRGSGAMLAINLRAGFEAAGALTSSTKLFTHAVSLGGVDSLIQHPAALTHRPVASEAKPSMNLVRLSVGLEDIEDLMEDLDQGLRVPSAVASAGVNGRHARSAS